MVGDVPSDSKTISLPAHRAVGCVLVLYGCVCVFLERQPSYTLPRKPAPCSVEAHLLGGASIGQSVHT